MIRRSVRWVVIVAGLATIGMACAPAPTPGSVEVTVAGSTTAVVPVSASTTTTQLPTTVAVAGPIGVIAIGHSGLTGEGTGARFEPVPENSWATGTSPAVNSAYLRLTGVRPETQGHVANQAQGGASASMLSDQAQRALRIVPTPALAIISTIDNDIRCDGTDPQNIGRFGMDVANALEVITTASPNTRILVVGQLGRPSPDFIEPAVKSALTGTGMCDFYDPDGNLIEENFQTLTGIIEAYETEQARVCALVPRCRTDGGVRAAYVDTLENFSSDWAHLNIGGQAAQAELIWPTVAELLELPPP
jgi:hypothetical protein